MVSRLHVEARDAVHMRSDGETHHSKGQGNWYFITLGGIRVYVEGETENT